MSDPASVAPPAPVEWGVITPGLPNGLRFKPNNGRLEFPAVYFTRIGDIVTVTGSFNLIDGSGAGNWTTRIWNFPYDPTFRADYPLITPGSVTCNHFPSPIVGAWIFYSGDKSLNLSLYARGSENIYRGTVMFSCVYSITGIDLPAETIRASFSDPIQD